MVIKKEFYKSKTMWTSIIIAVVTTILPEAKALVEENPQAVMGAVGFIFGLLRITTDSSVVVKKDKGITINE